MSPPIYVIYLYCTDITCNICTEPLQTQLHTEFLHWYLAALLNCEKHSLKRLLFPSLGIAHPTLIEKVQDTNTRKSCSSLCNQRMLNVENPQ